MAPGHPVHALLWPTWRAGYRDVIILNKVNVPVARFNLTTYDLNVPANYDSLKTLLHEAASGSR